MVAGMTPTTVKVGFVSAVLDAGHHFELAGGNQSAPVHPLRQEGLPVKSFCVAAGIQSSEIVTEII
jgi:enoyl reductase-like protein